MDLEELVVKIKGDISDFKAKMNDAGKEVNSFGDFVSKNSTKFLVAGGAITGALGVFVKNAAEAEVANSQLANALRVAGEYSEATMNKMLNLATQIQNYSGLSDEALQSAMRFGLQLGLSGDQVTQLLPKIVDFSTATGVDLNTAMKMASVSLEGNTGMLKRYGVEIKKGEDGTVAFNDVLNAFAGFAGSAETQGSTLTGQLNIMKQQFGDLTEKLGGALIPILKDLIDKYILPLIDHISNLNPQVLDWGIKIAGVAGAVLMAVGTIGKLSKAVTSLATLFSTTVAGTPIGLILLGISAVVFAITEIVKHWDQIKEAMAGFYEKWVKPWLDPLIKGLQKVIDFFVKIADFFKNLWGKVKEVFTSPAVPEETTWGGFQSGGYVTKPTLAWIGEREPEYVIPESKMGVNVTYNIYGASDMNALRRELKEHDRELLNSLRGSR